MRVLACLMSQPLSCLLLLSLFYLLSEFYVFLLVFLPNLHEWVWITKHTDTHIHIHADLGEALSYLILSD